MNKFICVLTVFILLQAQVVLAEFTYQRNLRVAANQPTALKQAPLQVPIRKQILEMRKNSGAVMPIKTQESKLQTSYDIKPYKPALCEDPNYDEFSEEKIIALIFKLNSILGKK